MKTVTIELYEFGELAESVRKDIVGQKTFDVMDSVMNGMSDEWTDSLKAFEDATGFGARNWEVGYYEHSFRRTNPEWLVMGMEPEDIKGRLLWRWCYRFVRDNRRGRYYGKLVPCEKSAEHPAGLRHVFRHSKAIMEPITGGWCLWTGVVTDCSLVEPIVDFYQNYHRGKYGEDFSLENLIDNCLEQFFDEWESQYNAYGDNRDNVVEEELKCRYEGDMFYANGKRFEGELKTA